VLALVVSMVSAPDLVMSSLLQIIYAQVDNAPTISNDSITKSFSFPILLFEDEVVSEVKQTIMWNLDGSTVISDDRGNSFTLNLPKNQGKVTLLQSGESVIQRFSSQDLQYDINWVPMQNEKGIVDKYKFAIVGDSKKPSAITIAVTSSQDIEAKGNRFTALKNNIYDRVLQSNSTVSDSQILEGQKEGIGLDWSDAVSAGYDASFDSESKMIRINVDKSFNIDPTTVTTVSAAISPFSTDYYEGERRVVEINSNIFAFYYDGSNIRYRFSTNGGTSWTTGANQPATGTINSDNNRWTIANISYATSSLGPTTDYIILFYFQQSGTSTDFRSMRGTVSGTTITWGSATTLFSVANNAACSSGVCAAATAVADSNIVNGRIHVAFRYLPSGASSYAYRILTSTNGGSSWTTSLAEVSTGVGTRVEMTLTELASGNMLLAFARYDSANLFYRVYTHSTSSWGAVQSQTSTGMSANTIKQISSDSDYSGKAFVTFLNGGTSGTLRVARFTNTGTFSAFETADNTLSHALPSITVTPDGTIRIYTLSGNRVYVTQKSDHNGSWAAPANPFGTSFTSPNGLTSGIGQAGALWHEGSATPYNLRYERTNIDVDNDGIYDLWETSGIDGNLDGTNDLTLAGANSQRKDIYIEIDYMEFHHPTATAITNVINAFNNAPVTNPNGVNGINLHIDIDEQITHQNNITWETDFNTIKNSNFGTATERANANTIAAKRMVYHYNLWAHNYNGGTSSGVAELPGNDFIVSLGSFTSVGGHNVGDNDEQAGTLIHELGHNLNLQHGGTDSINCKPNYLSVMSYAFQFNDYVSTRPIDYSRSQLNTLNENSLNEATGVSASTPTGLTTVYGPTPRLTRVTGQAFDWNRDGDMTDTGVVADVSNIGISSCGASVGQNLIGYNDWANIRLAPTTSVSFRADGIGGNVEVNEMTIEHVRQIRQVNIDSIASLIASMPDGAFKNSESKNILNNMLLSEADGAIKHAKTDDVKNMVKILKDIRSKADGSVGNSKEDDLIIDATMQMQLLKELDNVIAAYET
jgi:hypothetical protein